MMEKRLQQENDRLGKSHIRLNNLETSLRFPCLGLNPTIDSIILSGSVLKKQNFLIEEMKNIPLFGRTSVLRK